MAFAIIFVIAFVAIGVFALYLSRTIEHGEARFDTRDPDAGGNEAPRSEDGGGDDGEHDTPV